MGFKRTPTEDQALSQVQDQVAASLGEIERTPFQGGQILQSISLTSGQDNLVPHKLSRTLQIWVLAGLDVNSTVWSPTSTELAGQSSDTRFLNLRCSTSCTVSLWVA